MHDSSTTGSPAPKTGADHEAEVIGKIEALRVQHAAKTPTPGSRPSSRLVSHVLDEKARREAQALREADELFQRCGCPRRNAQAVIQPGNSRWTEALAQISSVIGTGMTLILVGPYRTGKTQLAVEWLRESARQGREGLYMTAQRLFASKRDAQNAGAETAWFNRYVQVPSLVIDELSDRGETEAENRALRELLDGRFGWLSDTVLIGNFTADEMEAALGEKLRARIAEAGAIIECDWGAIHRDYGAIR